MPALITFRKCSRKNISFRPRNTAPANKPRKNRRNSSPYRKIQTDRRINVCQTRIKYKLPHKVCRLHGKTMRKIKSITTVNIRPHSGWLFFFGYNPNIFSNTQVRLLLTYQSCVVLLATRKRVSRIKNTQLIRLFISF